MSPARHKLRTLTRSQILVLAAAAAAVVFLVGSVLWAQLGQQQAVDQTGVVEQQRDEERSAKDATAAQAQQAVDPVLELCAQGDAVAQALRARGACDLAEQVAATPVPTQPQLPGATGEPGRPPTAAEIQAAVDVFLVAHPPPAGRAPTPAEVAAAVASFLTANPPTPGRAPTAEEIAQAVEAWFAANPPPPGEPGEDGKNGEPGRPPTSAEIRAAVEAELAAHPPPAGPKGDDGEPGPSCPADTSLQPVEFASGETGLGCVDDEQPPPPTADPIATTTAQVPGDTTSTDGDNPSGSP